MIVGQEKILVRILKSKLQDLHAGEAELVTKFDDRVIDLTEIFGNDGHMITESCFKHGKEVIAGSAHPFTLDRSLFTEGNCPVFIKAAEMVDPQIICQGQLMSDPVEPPFVTCFRMLGPVIKRIAPKLAGG